MVGARESNALGGVGAEGGSEGKGVMAGGRNGRDKGKIEDGCMHVCMYGRERGKGGREESYWFCEECNLLACAHGHLHVVDLRRIAKSGANKNAASIREEALEGAVAGVLRQRERPRVGARVQGSRIGMCTAMRERERKDIESKGEEGQATW